MLIEYGDEAPEHGLCWRCSTERVTVLEDRCRQAILTNNTIQAILDPEDTLWEGWTGDEIEAFRKTM
jgi:hypothetical protein